MPHPNRDAHKSPTNMAKHLKGCFKYQAYMRDQRDPDPQSRVDSFSNFFNDGHRPRPIMTTELLCEKVLRVIIAGNLAFAQVENTELVDLLKDAYPDCTSPSRRAVADLLHRTAAEAKRNICNKLMDLDSKVSLALDVWTTRHNLAFLGTFSLLVTGSALVRENLKAIPLHSNVTG